MQGPPAACDLARLARQVICTCRSRGSHDAHQITYACRRRTGPRILRAAAAAVVSFLHYPSQSQRPACTPDLCMDGLLRQNALLCPWMVHLMKSIPDQCQCRCRCSRVKEKPPTTCRVGQNLLVHLATRQGNPVIRCSCHRCRHKFNPRRPTFPYHTHTHSHSHSNQRDCLQDHPGSIACQQSTQITRDASVEGGLSRIASVQPQLFAHQRRGLVMCQRATSNGPNERAEHITARKSPVDAAACCGCCDSSSSHLPPRPCPPARPPENSRPDKAGRQADWPWQRSAAG